MTNHRELASATRAARGLGRRHPLAASLVATVAKVAKVALIATVACGQRDPDDAGDGAELQPYFPLVAGAWWEYSHSDWDERVTVEPTEFDGAPAFMVSDSPNPDDDLRSDSVITSVNGRAARVTKQEYFIGSDGTETLQSTVSYGVGFTRFDENWANQAVGYRETPAYERVETRPDGSVRAPEARRHTFEILSLSEDVSTARGTFNCIVIRRTKDWQAEEDGIDADDAEAKQFWFARGVGKVQELNLDSGNVETLTDFMIPAP